MKKTAMKAFRMLDEKIIPFWLGLMDKEYGGFCGFVDYYTLERDWKYEKGCILNSRILWFFSEAAMLYQEKGRDASSLIEAADHAYAFLHNCCLDEKNGGIYWSMTYDGKPLDTTKHTYNQAFAIYALSSYYRLSGKRKAVEEAFSIFDEIEKHCTDEKGYLEAFTVDWGPESNEKLSENGVMAQKTMNTLLHVFEGYSGLYLATKDLRVGLRLRRILDIYGKNIYDKEGKRLFVFFDENYSSIIDLWSYGHDIEASWLVDWGTGLLEDETLSKAISSLNTTLAESVLRDGYRNHALLNEREKGIDDPTRNWWVQAEAVLGFANEWSKHPEKEAFKKAAEDIYRFIEESFIDPREGSEWYSALDQNGNPIDKPIVEPWKCPYHNGRLCMEFVRRYGGNS